MKHQAIAGAFAALCLAAASATTVAGAQPAAPSQSPSGAEASSLRQKQQDAIRTAAIQRTHANAGSTLRLAATEESGTQLYVLDPPDRDGRLLAELPTAHVTVAANGTASVTVFGGLASGTPNEQGSVSITGAAFDVAPDGRLTALAHQPTLNVQALTAASNARPGGGTDGDVSSAQALGVLCYQGLTDPNLGQDYVYFMYADTYLNCSEYGSAYDDAQLWTWEFGGPLADSTRYANLQATPWGWMITNRARFNCGNATTGAHWWAYQNSWAWFPASNTSVSGSQYSTNTPYWWCNP